MESPLNKFVHFHWKNNKGRLIALFAILIILLAALIILFKVFYDKEWSDTVGEVFINLLASLLAFLFTIAIIYLITHNLQRHEDEIKASYLNSNLQEQYSPKGENENGYRKDFILHKDSGKFIVYINDLYRQDKDNQNHLYFSDDSNTYFEPDLYIMMHVGTLYGAHATSKTVSELTVRLNDFHYDKNKDKKAIAYTTRSTYLAHLLTNRAIDYPLEEDLTVRKIFENTEELTPLNRSKLSNHIGVNALIFLTDPQTKEKYLILPKRGKDATVAKNGVTASIATRLNLKAYEACFPKTAKDQLVDEHTISQACVINNLTSALLIDEKYEKEMQEMLKKKENMHFLGLSRDPYEGGKPTLFYYIELEMTKEEFISKLNPYYEPAGIDSVHELLFVKWTDIQITTKKKNGKGTKWEDDFKEAVEKKQSKKGDSLSKLEIMVLEDQAYDCTRLQLNKYDHYSRPKKSKEYTMTFDEKEQQFIFEQNLIANLWFYVNKDNNETQS